MNFCITVQVLNFYYVFYLYLFLLYKNTENGEISKINWISENFYYKNEIILSLKFEDFSKMASEPIIPQNEIGPFYIYL